MKRTVLYTRVSTEEQASHGFSLRHQRESLVGFCEFKNDSVIKHFEDDFSAKDFNRPAFKQLELYCKANKNDIDQILFTRWDRFSRNAEAAYGKIRQFQSWGIEVNALEQPLDFDIPESKLLLAIYLATPEIENDKNSLRTTEGSRKARKEGFWTGPAPFGYTNSRNEKGRPTLTINDQSHFVVKAFEMMSTGLYTAEEVRRKLKQEGLALQKQAFLNALRNVAYKGKIFIKAWKKEEAYEVDSYHEAIISEEVFNKVQATMKSKNRQAAKPKKYNPDLPLRGHLICSKCGRNLTGSKSRSRNKKLYAYYHCKNDCPESFSAPVAHEDFAQLLKQYTINDEIKELYLEIIKDIFSELNQDSGKQILKLKDEIALREASIEDVEDKYYNPDIIKQISREEYDRVTSRYKREIRDKSAKIEELKLISSDASKHFTYCIGLLSNLKGYFDTSDIETKHALLGSIFPEKLIYSNNNYRTTKENSIFSLFGSLKPDFNGKKPKQASINADLYGKAPEAGLEPATL